MNDLIKAAFAAVDRANFVLPEYRDLTSLDSALPIGFGQTISQPTTVRLMLEWLELGRGQQVLDVGFGSGWTSALLSHIVGSRGKVEAVEKVPELVEFGRQNCKRAGVKNVSFHRAGEVYGWPDAAPYDRILVSAAAPSIPPALIDQLKVSGIMVIPVGSSILVATKQSKSGRIKIIDHPGFAFVPLVS